MKLTWPATVAVVLLGAAAMLLYTWHDQDQKLRTGQWQRVELEVVRTEFRALGKQGALVLVKWQDPADRSTKDGSALISSEDKDSSRFQPGQRVAGWVHPGFWHAELGETAPNLEPDQSFLLPAAGACAALGLALLAFAVKTGRIFS
ncbi:MAG: hypothetical protein HY902_13980 [Deltaproteobacteria bacterium]|nr:hypothetical protein [Deltaproteobacteria bacterium]